MLISRKERCKELEAGWTGKHWDDNLMAFMWVALLLQVTKWQWLKRYKLYIPIMEEEAGDRK